MKSALVHPDQSWLRQNWSEMNAHVRPILSPTTSPHSLIRLPVYPYWCYDAGNCSFIPQRMMLPKPYEMPIWLPDNCQWRYCLPSLRTAAVRGDRGLNEASRECQGAKEAVPMEAVATEGKQTTTNKKRKGQRGPRNRKPREQQFKGDQSLNAEQGGRTLEETGSPTVKACVTTQAKEVQKNKCNNNEKQDIVIDLGKMIAKTQLYDNKRNKAANGGKRGQWCAVGCVAPDVGCTGATSKGSKCKAEQQTAEIKIRGKTRETGTKKKQTRLKKLIIRERQEKLCRRELIDWRVGNLDDNGQQDSDGELSEGQKLKVVKQKIHNRRFRDYCIHCLSAEIDNECSLLVKLVHDFQTRAYQKDQLRAKMKRRYVAGLRQVSKCMQAGVLQLVIMAPNCEVIKADEGLDSMITKIVAQCEEKGILCVFAMDRRRLGRCVNAPVGISAIGILDYSGANIVYKRLKGLVEEATVQYSELVKATLGSTDFTGMDWNCCVSTCEEESEEPRDTPAVVNSMSTIPLPAPDQANDKNTRLGISSTSHTRNLSGTIRVIKPQHNRVVLHNRQTSDLCAHLCSETGTSLKRIIHAPKLTALPMISQAPELQEQIDEYNDRVEREFTGRATNVVEKLAQEVQCSKIEYDNALDGDVSSNADD